MKNWQNAIIPEESNIRDSLRKIDNAALKIGFVCNDKNILIGTVSDGDIRRGLLADVGLNDPIKLVINSNPIICSENESKSSMLAILKEKGIEVLPIVNCNGELTNVVTINSLQKRTKRDNPIFIMAGGFGTRLKPLTDKCPKPMLPLGEKPLLEHIIKRFIEQGFWNFYVSTHYLSHVITDYFGDGSSLGISIKYISEEIPLGTGGALSLLPKDIIQLPLILINGDVLTDLDFEDVLKTHEKDKSIATMCLKEIETSIAYGVVTVQNNKVKNMLEKPTFRHLINTGIYVLSYDLIKSSSNNERIDLPTILEKQLEIGKTISAHKFYGQWIDIGHMDDYKRALNEVNRFDI